MVYIYPENLKAAPTLWLWQLRDLTIGGALAVLGAVLLMQFGIYLVAALAVLYLFLTIRFEDACILDFIRKAAVYFLLKPQRYRWGFSRKYTAALRMKSRIQASSKRMVKNRYRTASAATR